MIDFRWEVETAEGMREIRVFADKLDDPSFVDGVLAKFDKEHMRPTIMGRFDERKGWAPRAKATQQASARHAATRVDRSLNRLGARLGRELARAERNLGKLAHYTGRNQVRDAARRREALGKRSTSLSTALQRRVDAVHRRAFVVEALADLRASGDALSPAYAANKAIEGDKQGARLIAKLQERIKRSTEKSTPLLGNIPLSFKTEVSDGTLIDGSTIPWSGVQNKGGTVGHGAKIPPRPFAFIEDADVEELVRMLVEELGDEGSAGFGAI